MTTKISFLFREKERKSIIIKVSYVSFLTCWIQTLHGDLTEYKVEIILKNQWTLARLRQDTWNTHKKKTNVELQITDIMLIFRFYYGDTIFYVHFLNGRIIYFDIQLIMITNSHTFTCSFDRLMFDCHWWNALKALNKTFPRRKYKNIAKKAYIWHVLTDVVRDFPIFL